MVKSVIVDLMIKNARNNVATQDKVQNSMLMKINKKGTYIKSKNRPINFAQIEMKFCLCLNSPVNKWMLLLSIYCNQFEDITDMKTPLLKRIDMWKWVLWAIATLLCRPANAMPIKEELTTYQPLMDGSVLGQYGVILNLPSSRIALGQTLTIKSNGGGKGGHLSIFVE